MTCGQCQGLERFFDRREAQRSLRRYQRRGPEKTTRALIEALRAEGLEGATVLDIGGGVGAIPNALIEAGAVSATDVDASQAYLEAARTEAGRRGHAERVTFHHGNFVEVAPRVPAADVVTLDRVICCYPDMTSLVGLSSERARRLYGLVFPRDTWWTRAALAVVNLVLRIFGNPMRTFVHATKLVDDHLGRAGLVRRFHRKIGFWQVAVWARGSMPRTDRTT
jgi:magnesium-protoporphyrin O-methyltransferase